MQTATVHTLLGNIIRRGGMMGRFFRGSNYHDDMHGNDGQLTLRYRHLPKEELEQISKSLYEAEESAVEREPVVLERFCDVELPPVVKILLYEYEELKRRSKRLEILERAFLECQKSEFEEFNDYPIGYFTKEIKNDTEV